MANTSGPFSMAINTSTFVNSRPSGNIAGSKNFLWYDGDRLGDGATGTVYLGREKLTGDLCAIKTFNAQARKRSSAVQSREFDVLAKLHHVNIVKILAMEEELLEKSRVLVMELCTGGSLYSILEHPANQFGLAESEFLLVLEHVSSGMKHLRDNNIIHRDLKPGNIMRYVTDSGESIYKLVDFGAARQLDDEEEFQSLYGTEEYLLPDMYESAVLDKHRKRQFGAQCDLWSLGVTFYHAATGTLPFRPYGGRRNRQMMHFITTTKKSGVISGVQKTENGPIQWSTCLPTTCRLSLGLKDLIRELLAGMLEPDMTKMMKFEKFFETVHSIVNKIPVHVFNVASGDMLRIYNNPVDSISSSHSKSGNDAGLSSSNSRIVVNLQDAIARQTDVAPRDQILIYDGVNLDVGLGVRKGEFGADGGGSPNGGGIISLADSFSESITEELLVNTQPDNPIFVLPRSSDCMKLRDPVVPPFDAYFVEVELSQDYRLAKQYCSVMYSISRQISSCAKVQSLLASVRKIMSRSLKSALDKLSYFEYSFKTRLETLYTTIQFAKTSQMAFSSLCDAALDIQPQVDAVAAELRVIESEYGGLFDLGSTFREVAKQAISSIPEDDCAPAVPCAGHVDAPCTNTINAVIEETTRIMNDFKADRKLETLAFNTEQIHKYDKHRLESCRMRALSKAECHCFFNTLTAHQKFVSWYEIALELMCALEKRISPMKSELDFKASLLAGKLSQFHVKLEHIHKHILKSAVSVVRNGQKNVNAGEEMKKRKVAVLMEKLAKDTERTSLAVGESNNMLMSMTEDLKGLEIVDTSAAAITIGGAETFYKTHSDYYAGNNSLGSLSS